MKQKYEIIRSNRKTLALQITREGAVVVRAPKRTSLKRIQEFVEEHQEWVERKLAQWQERELTAPRYTAEEEKAYRQQAVQVLTQRTAYFAMEMGVTYGRITIRGQKTRWGSCSRQGNLNFNWKLMLCPPEIQDYVVVHELAHRKQMNHSPAFYAEIERVLPDYQERERWLREHGRL